MDWLEFVARSEWPAVAVLAIVLLRKPIRDMMRRVNPTKLNAWGFQAEFSQALDKVEALSPLTAKPTESMKRVELSAEPDQSLPQFRRSGGSPDAMVVLAFRRLEKALYGPGIRLPDSLRRSVASAAKSVGMSADEIAQIQELRRLRNQVAHNDSVALTWEDATRFHEATEQLIGRVRELQRNNRDQGPPST